VWALLQLPLLPQRAVTRSCHQFEPLDLLLLLLLVLLLNCFLSGPAALSLAPLLPLVLYLASWKVGQLPRTPPGLHAAGYQTKAQPLLQQTAHGPGPCRHAQQQRQNAEGCDTYSKQD
jgi:hypothetical protein